MAWRPLGLDGMTEGEKKIADRALCLLTGRHDLADVSPNLRWCHRCEEYEDADGHHVWWTGVDVR